MKTKLKDEIFAAELKHTLLVFISFVMVMAISGVHFCLLALIVADWSEFLKPWLWLVHLTVLVENNKEPITEFSKAIMEKLSSEWSIRFVEIVIIIIIEQITTLSEL